VTNALDKADSLGDVESISIPALASGMYGFPKERCARVIIDACVEWIMKNGHKSKVKTFRLCVIDDVTVKRFRE